MCVEVRNYNFIMCLSTWIFSFALFAENIICIMNYVLLFFTPKSDNNDPTKTIYLYKHRPIDRHVFTRIKTS